MMKKNITIDELAVMVQKGFNETAKKTDMELKFKEIDRRFDKVETRLGKIEYLLSGEDIKELKGLLAV